MGYEERSKCVKTSLHCFYYLSYKVDIDIFISQELMNLVTCVNTFQSLQYNIALFLLFRFYYI